MDIPQDVWRNDYPIDTVLMCTDLILGMGVVGLGVQIVSESAQLIARNAPRYVLSFPASVKVNNSSSRTIPAVSEKISHCFLLSKQLPIFEGTGVDAVITFATATNSGTIHLAASGKVLPLAVC
jgi:hypothetical protein